MVLLINPKVGFYNLVTRDLPLALLSAARCLDPACEVVLVDERLPDWRARLDDALRGGPLCVGLTAMTGAQIRHGLAIAERVRRLAPRVPIVWGGVHASMLPEQTLADPRVDIVVAGEGELTFAELVRRLHDRRPLDGVPGLWFKRPDGTTAAPPGPAPFADLDALPLLPYGLLRAADYCGFSHAAQGRTLDIETGRGCRYRCAYCYNAVFNRGARRALSAARIAEHIRHLQRWAGPLDVVNFIDDNFLLEADRREPLVGALRGEFAPLRWRCETDVNELHRLDDAQLRALAASGLTSLSLGIESGSERILRMVGKPVRLEDARAVNRRLAACGIAPQYNVISGFVTETRAELNATTRLALDLLDGNPLASVQSMVPVVPFPGTRYLEMAVEHGFRPPARLEDWGAFNPESWFAVCPWYDRATRLRLKTIYVASLFVDVKARMHVPREHALSLPLRAAARLYRPLARRRFRTCSAALPVEVAAFELMRRCAA